MQAGQPDAAERLFKQVLQLQPRHLGALNLLGVLLTSLQRFDEAERYTLYALRENAASDATLYNYGLILKALKRPAEALERFGQALRLNPTIPETWNNRGTVLNELRRYTEAIDDFDKALGLNPLYAEAYSNKGKALLGLKRLGEAGFAFDRAITLKRDLAGAWCGGGSVCRELNRYEDALVAFDRTLAIKPDLAEAWLGRGSVLVELERLDEAFAAFDRAAALTPGAVEAWLGRATALRRLKRYEDALAALDEASRLKPDAPAVFISRGATLSALERYSDAIVAYDRALALEPDSVDAWLGRGNELLKRKQIEEALDCYEKALSITPDFAEAWFGRGNACTQMGRLHEAVAAFDRALAAKPGLAEAQLGRGIVFERLSRGPDALKAYNEALALKPCLAEAWRARGELLSLSGDTEDAIASFDKALGIDRNLQFAAGSRLLAKLRICDWANMEAEVESALATIRDEKLRSVGSYAALPLSTTPADQLQCAKSSLTDQLHFPPAWRGEIYKHRRIRVAYLSADFHDHPVSHLMVGLFEQHDRSRFEVNGISFLPGDNSVVRDRIEKGFEHFVDVSGKGDQEIAELIRAREIDITVDLMGYMENCRPNVFARRAAPIQVSYLGYPGTTGADYIDYIFADPIIIPEEDRCFYAEHVVYLPSYQVNDNKRQISNSAPNRDECGLPERAFVFCCFNNAFKITPELFGVWMRILRSVDDSVLWLRRHNDRAAENLRREAERRGVSADRLVFAERVPTAADHLARHALADLFLDTLPYNAHTTASDALWAGLPVITCLGKAFPGRVAASVLKSAGLDEFVTTSVDEYESLAVALAHDRPRLEALKAKVAHNRGHSLLFDTDRFRRNIEHAYATMVEMQRRGEAPRSFSVEPQ